MPDQLNDQTTQSLNGDTNARFDRLESLILSLTAQVATLQASSDRIEQTQREMYIDLRGHIKIVQDSVSLLRREFEQYVQDQQPGSVHSRLMR